MRTVLLLIRQLTTMKKRSLKVKDPVNLQLPVLI